MPRGGSQIGAQDAVVLRLVTLLRFLADEARAVPVRRLRRLLPDYGSDAGLPTFNRDLEELRGRGVVTLSTAGADGLVRLSPLDKRTDWYLTTDEHVALGHAREAVGAAPAATGPLAPGHQSRLDLLLRVLRYVEEQRRPPTIAELAVEFACSAQQLRGLLWLVAEDPVAGSGVPGLRLDSPDRSDSTTDDDGFASTVVRLDRPDGSRAGAHPMVGRGLQLLGAFPYTAAEAEDRLRVIAAALKLVPAASQDQLRSAQWKLQEWRDHLQAMSDSV